MRDKKTGLTMLTMSSIIALVLLLEPIGMAGTAPQNSNYFTHATISITSNLDFTLANGVTGGAGTPTDPYIISFYEINASANHGLYIENTDAYVYIYNCFVRDGGTLYNGIYLNNVQNAYIDDCVLVNNKYGILFENSNNNTILNNNASSNYYIGIYGTGNHNIVGINDVFSGLYSLCRGIDIRGNHSAIKNNNIGNNYWGIFNIGDSNVISKNTITSNGAVGIFFIGMNNIIANNSVSLNAMGIQLGDATSNNIIYHNNFMDNTYQEYDNTSGNTWNLPYPSGGNFWGDSYTGADNYYGTEQNKVGIDGLGDSAYNIWGEVGAKDNYPLMEPWGTDTIPPISFVNLISPYILMSASVILSAQSIDVSETSSVEFWFRHCTDNSTWGSWTQIMTDTTEPWSTNFNFTGGYGYYEFYSRARDSTNNYEIALTKDTACKYSQPIVEPSAPQNLQATAGDGQVIIDWDAPTSDGGASITNYNLYRGQSAGSETLLITLGNVLTYTDTAVTNGNTYFYQASAVNSVGESSKSNEDSALPKAAATLPSAPQSLQVASGIGQLVLTWLSPSSDGGSAITGYKIYRGTASNGEIVLTTIGNVLTYTNSGLGMGQLYYYKVSAINDVGEGTLSNEDSSETFNLPSAPQSLTGEAGNGEVYLSWTQPTDDGGSPITQYKIYRGTSTTNEVLLTTVGNQLTWTDNDVQNSQIYYYKIKASNLVGDSIFSNEVHATPEATINPDSDYDDLPDVWENSQLGSLLYNSDDDPDGDGYSNIEEYEAHSDPDDITSTPETNTDLLEAGGVDWQLWIEITGLLLAIAGIVYGIYEARKRRVTLRNYLHRLDDTFNTYSSQSQECERKLYEYKEEIDKLLEQGKLPETQYNVLRERVESYLKKIKGI